MRATAGLEWLNGLSAAEAERELLTCCASHAWASRVASGRPYASLEAVAEAAEGAWWGLPQAAWEEAFAAQPRIGDREAAGAVERQEQAGVALAAPETLAELAAGNRLYEARFGRVFLVCATGKSADEMLALLRARLDHDEDTELSVAAGEQAKITRLRLERLLDARS